MNNIEEQLQKLVENNHEEIDKWFAEQYKNTAPFFYSSVDLRHSGFKIVPVDTNLFPAGFNLLSENALKNAISGAKEYFKKQSPHSKKILIIPENHTRNLYYLENVAAIYDLLQNAGLEVQIGGLMLENDENILELESASGNKLTYKRIISENGNIATFDGFKPDSIIVNNDLTSGAPEILKNIEQNIIPPVGMGWYQRRKTNHFDTYRDVARSFAKKFNIDEWLITAEFHKCGTINFKERKGLECVARGVEKTLYKVRKKYEEYGITEEPYVFIKSDSGTYGMGIMTVSSAEEVMEINKKERNKMSSIKEGSINSQVIIQEGVPTIDKINGKVAEPMIYMINGDPIGCTYRINESRDEKSNLNSKGMSFINACEGDIEASQAQSSMCPVQKLVAKLASLAATRECYEENWEI